MVPPCVDSTVSDPFAIYSALGRGWRTVHASWTRTVRLGIYRAAPIRPGSCVHPGHRLCGPSLYIFCTTGKLAEQPGRSTVHALSSQWRPLPPQVQTRGKQHVSELPLCSRRPHRTFIPLSPSCRAIVMAIVQVEARSLCSWNSMPFFIGVRSPPPLCSRRPHRTSIPLPSRARSGPHPPFPISYVCPGPLGPSAVSC